MGRFSRRLTGAGVLAIGLIGALGGCATHDRHADVPSDAAIVAEGTNRMSYKAPRDGTVYVFNRVNGKMEYSGRVVRGDNLVVDPDRDKITLNGKDVNDKPINNDQKRIFFEPDATTASQRTTERVYEERSTYRQSP